MLLDDDVAVVTDEEYLRLQIGLPRGPLEVGTFSRSMDGSSLWQVVAHPNGHPNSVDLKRRELLVVR